MSDPNDDRRRRDTGTDASDGPTNHEEEAAADVNSGTGVGDNPRVDDRDPGNEATQIASEERRRKTSVVSAIVAIIGAWVALSVLFYGVSGAILWNNVLVGATVFVAAGYNYYRLANDIPLSAGVASLVAVLGIWLIISAALLEMPAGAGLADSPFWSTLVSGFLIAGLSGYNAYEAREARSVATEPETSA
ncbi:SPW repeat domain-containing protein [Natronobacterium texcoconense]|uniref:SPW repeat-containing integral membrane domain-containing protein n=1 Tax=Natronobacterium texcoconense TaxID=1095778 RepID=A0A1H1GUD2_NATTX|nr:hypothetical protein [Natronobacterium texcoconense]SDR16815.1 hypothetical protein SAMN04489842_2618 [Natronobacterium texcoconense]